MFLQSWGYNDKDEEISFIAFSPKDLLKHMLDEKMKEVKVATNELGEMPIIFCKLTEEDVIKWIDTGHNPKE